MSMEIAGKPVNIPAGWSVQFGRETSQYVNGQNQPGVLFNLVQTGTNATLTEFIPYSVLPFTDMVAQQFTTKINAYEAAAALGSSGLS